jgi:Tol biopolymer transport system component
MNRCDILLKTGFATIVAVLVCGCGESRRADEKVGIAHPQSAGAAGSYFDRWPRFSPDGRWIAFTSNRTGINQIYVIHPNGTGLARVTNDPTFRGQVAGATWLAGGNLLYERSRPTNTSSIDNGLNVDEFVETRPDGTGSRILYAGMNSDRPSASPSGESIAFEAEHGPYQANPNIDIFRFDVRSLTLRLLAHGGQSMEAAWAPSGSRVAFACRARVASPIQICVTDAAGQHTETLLQGVTSREWPAWSPDSRRIAYFSERTISGRLDATVGILDADGIGEVIITRHEGYRRDECPDWSPDGRSIAFQTDRNGNGFRIATMDSQGHNVRMVTK